jgi:catechol 2,3-dioxygenase-like lactoylglutathione lyase family enzyme
VALHRLTQVTIGVPNMAETVAYYTEFGLTPGQSPGTDGTTTFSTADGGEQLRVVPSPYRRLVTLGVGADDLDDLRRIEASLRRLDTSTDLTGGQLVTAEPVTGVTVAISVAPRISQRPVTVPAYNSPGNPSRAGTRAPGILRAGRVRPRKLGHVVFGSVDQETTQRFFAQGLGFKVSDEAPGLAAFMRCSTDHHNVLVQQGPVNFLHHTSWELEDVDEVGRGAKDMLDGHPERHTWGLGRHYIGSNFFWYLRDPAGNFSEYYSDIDCIPEDQIWEPAVVAGEKALYAWGPPPPPSFLQPEDLAALMAGAHSAR